MATPVDFPKYLQSLVDSYETKYRRFYTLTDLQVEVRVENSPEDRSPQTPKKQPETKIDRLEVIAGIRKYLHDGNVLLVGKPGSGKSTVLQRFRWELAREALKDGDRPIPVLVELRHDWSIVEAICAAFRREKLRVSAEQVDDLLLDDKLLLLLDGVNEMPSQKRREELQLFRDGNSDTPMIFTTRDLALGGFLGIEKQLEMCPLTKPQMREFVHKYSQHGDLLLQQLGDRLREIAETPLLLWMMCEVFQSTGEIPQSKGELFQKFDRRYDKFKDVPLVSDNFRRFKPDLLQQLAFVMLQGDLQQPAEGLVAISRDRAQGILKRWLHHRGVLDAPTKAKEWLEDLLEHHLLQVAAKPEEIEFHHQLFQEYYAGRALLKLLVEKHDDVTDDERLQHFYLNYFKWREPLAFMLSLLGDEVQAVRVVRLALDVDLMLGARLAGEVQREFQKFTVGLVDRLDVPGWLKVGLLGEVRSDEAIPGLLKFVEDSDSDVRRRAVDALGKIGSEAAIPGLLKLVEDLDPDVYSSVAYALGKIGFDAAIPELMKLVEDSDDDMCWSAVDALAKKTSKTKISELLELITNPDYDVRRMAADALGEIGSDKAISGLVKLIKHSEHDVAWLAVDILGQIGSSAAIKILLELVKNPDKNIRASVANALGEIGSTKAVLGLLQLVEDSDIDVRYVVVNALGEIGSDITIPGLIKLFEDSEPDVSSMAARLLGEMGSDEAILGLIKLLNNSDKYVVCVAADALGKICSDEAIPDLLKLVKDSDKNVRITVVEVLEKIGSDEAISGLRKLFNDSDYDVRRVAANAIDNISYDSGICESVELEDEDSEYNHYLSEIYSLGNISSEARITGLLKLLENSDSYVRWRAVDALGNIGSEVVIPGLLKLVEDSDLYVRWRAADALGEIASETAISGLLKLLKDSGYDVCNCVAEVLGEIAKQHAEKVVPHLPHLLTLIPSESGKDAHRLILAIQAACKYYNYPIRHLSLTPQPAKPPQPNELLAKIDETTQQIHKRTKEMSDKPTQDLSYSTFNAPVNFAPNYGNQAQNITISAQQSSPEAALNAVVQIIQALEKKYTYVKDEEQALNIIDAEFKEIKEQKRIEWQNLISVKRLYNGGKNAAVKVGEHFTESSVWGKAAVGFLEGVSEDVN